MTTGAELRVVVEAHDHLHPAVDHLLDQDAPDLGVGDGAADLHQELLEGLDQLVGPPHVETERVHLGLVADPQRLDLEGHRIADLLGRPDRLGQRAAEAAPRHGDPVPGEQREGLPRREDPSTFGPDIAQQRSDPFPAALRTGRSALPLPQATALGVLDEPVDRVHGARGGRHPSGLPSRAAT